MDGLLHRHRHASISSSPYQCLPGIQNLAEWMEDGGLPLPATNEHSAGSGWGHRLIIRRQRIYSDFGVTLPASASPLFFIKAPRCPGQPWRTVCPGERHMRLGGSQAARMPQLRQGTRWERICPPNFCPSPSPGKCSQPLRCERQ